jgi:hypothetical protein
MERRTLVLLLLLIAVPLVGGLAADAVFDYFLAARQFLWLLPAVAILAVSAWETKPRETIALIVLAVLLCGDKTFKYFVQPEPNWGAAAAAISVETDRGACLQVMPSNAREIYAYFAPQLAQDPKDCPAVVAAVIPGWSEDGLFEDLSRKGYTKLRTGTVGETSLTIFRRDSGKP